MCSTRFLPGYSGSETSGKLTAPTLDPLLLYLISLLATSMPMFSCASSVLPPMCGVVWTYVRHTPRLPPPVLLPPPPPRQGLLPHLPPSREPHHARARFH